MTAPTDDEQDEHFAQPWPKEFEPETLVLAMNIARNTMWPVFFCKENKAPCCPHGFKDAVVQPDDVRALWRQWPGPLIGIPTGSVSGHDVLDVDVGHPEACAWWASVQQRIPPTRCWRTRSGGLHVAFMHAPGVTNSTSRVATGVDVRGDGGYRICWSATPGLPAVDHSPIAPWPRWLLAAAMAKPAVPASVVGRAGAQKVGGVEALLRSVAVAPEGRRNSLLFWAAARMVERVRSGIMSSAVAEAELVAAAAGAGLAADEARRTVQSAFRGAA